MKPIYRIVTNGVYFKIQEFKCVGYIFRNRDWVDFRGVGGNVATFSNKRDAMVCLNELNKVTCEVHEWRVVETV